MSTAEAFPVASKLWGAYRGIQKEVPTLGVSGDDVLYFRLPRIEEDIKRWMKSRLCLGRAVKKN
jgi:hypothetical protein